MSNRILQFVRNNQMAVAIGLNIALSTMHVQLNKFIYYERAIPHLDLATMQQLVASLVMFGAHRLGFVSISSTPMTKMVHMAIVFSFIILTSNFSLDLNSNGGFLFFKSLSTPCILILSFFLHNRSHSVGVVVSVVLVVLGRYLNTRHGIETDFLGYFIGVVTASLVAAYHLLIKENQKNLDMRPTQLFYFQAPLSAILILILIPIFGSVLRDGFDYQYDMDFNAWVLSFLSGLLWIPVALSTYWIIGNSSALTFSMVNSFKIFPNLVYEAIMYGDYLIIEDLLALIFISAGIGLYYHLLRRGSGGDEETSKSSQQSRLPL